MIAALILFFAAIFSDSIYYHEKYRFGIKDAAESCGFMLIGAAVMLLVRFTIYGFLIGALIAVFAAFAVWVGFSVYQKATAKAPGAETAQVAVTEVNMTDYIEYLSELSSS